MTTLVPAYGRTYTNQKSVKQDWRDGKDFLIADLFDQYDGKPANCESFPPGSTHVIRYADGRKTVAVKACKIAEPIFQSWKVEVIADSSGKWFSNRLRFESESDAEDYGLDLAMHWGPVQDYRVVQSTDKPNR